MPNIKKALNHSLKNVVGCIVTHKHSDHAEFVPNLCESGIMVVGNDDVRLNALKKAKTRRQRVSIENNFSEIASRQKTTLGGFTIKALECYHDVDVPCLCYVIEHEELGAMLFATDTISVTYRFSNLTNIMIEANYLEDILSNNVANETILPCLAKRIRESHCEFYTTLECIKAQNLDKVRNIILIHLSNDNADGIRFRTWTQMATGIPCTIARAGKVIEL